MSGLHLASTIVVAAFVSFVLTRFVEQHAERFGLIQVPNARSSHLQPTPSGGGVAAAFTGILACIWLAILLGGELYALLSGLLCTIALLGFVDDLRDLSARLRLLIQAAVIVGLLALLSPLPEIALPFALSLGGMVTFLIFFVAGLWWLNLFNFMDGIDGLAASQTVLILSGGAVIWWSGDPTAAEKPAFAFMLLIAASAAGFLIRNWPPARIFMGDAGSNFLALAIFAVALMAASVGGPDLPTWLILVGAFASDATITLLRRIARGEKAWVAHRRHGYQRLSRVWGHGWTTLAYAGVTLLFLVPCAWVSSAFERLSWLVVVICYLLLGMGMLVIKAGSAEE